eukprot:s369_g44.t1
MRMVSSTSAYCGGCHGHWHYCHDTTYVHKAHRKASRAPQRAQQDYAPAWTQPPWEEEEAQWRHGQKSASPRKRTQSPRQRSGSARPRTGQGPPPEDLRSMEAQDQNYDKGYGKGKGTTKGGAAAFGHLPPSAQWMQPPSHPFLEEQQVPLSSSLPMASTALQPFGKTKAEKDREEAELAALRNLAAKVRVQPEDQSDDVKKALAAVEANIRKDDAKSYHQLVSSVKAAKKKLLDVEEQWEAFRTQWTQYLDKATKMWTAHIDSYEEGENKFAEKRKEAAAHLQQIRGQLHDIHIRTMEGTVTKVELQEGQTALDTTMQIEDMDNVTEQPQFGQLKTDLKGVVQKVKESIEEKMTKRSLAAREADGDEIEIVDAETKRPREST